MAIITDTATLSSRLDEFKGGVIASAATTDIGAATGNLVHVSGTTTITSLGTAVQPGIRRVVIFDGALTLTSNAVILLPSGASIVTAANDRATFVADTATIWVCTHYSRATAQPLVTATPLVTLNTSYRNLYYLGSSITAAVVAGTYGLGFGAAAAVSGTGVALAQGMFSIAAADLPTVDGITTKMRVRFLVNTNAVAPTGNFTAGLYPVTRVTGGAAGLVLYTLGTVVTSSTALVTTPAATTATAIVSADFVIPADGMYTLGVVTSASVAASAHVHLTATLQMRNA